MAKQHDIPSVKKIFLSSNVGNDPKLAEYLDTATGKLNQRFGKENVAQSNGSYTFSMTNLEERIVKRGDAFVFMPIPEKIGELGAKDAPDFFREMFKAASLVVGRQTKDPYLRLNHEDPQSPWKPVVLVTQGSKCWDPFIEMMDHLHKLGTIVQDPKELLQMVSSNEEALKILETAHEQKLASRSAHRAHHETHDAPFEHDPSVDRKPDFNVCVFCSASTKDPNLLQAGEDLGKKIAHKGWGLISGMGRTGIMGSVVRGAASAIKDEGKGWVGGSNLKRIIDMEGTPDYCDKFWERPDIYSRMEVMIKESQAFVIMPGGMGTVQELLALLLLKHTHEKHPEADDLMRDELFGNKKIIIVNEIMKNRDGSVMTYPKGHDKAGKPVRFWDKLQEFAVKYGFDREVKFVDSIDGAMEKLEKQHKAHLSRATERLMAARENDTDAAGLLR